MTESLEIQAARRMLAEAEILGVGDHPAAESMREMIDTHAHGPLNGGALMWWHLTGQHLKEVDWPVGCCIGNDMNSPEHCGCWVPVFDLEQAEVQPVASVEQCPTQVGLCGDCAYRPNSPERANDYEEEVLLDLARSKNQIFFCHEGMRRPTKWVHPDGREVPGNVKDYQPPYVDGIPYRADGRPGLVCGGYWALRTKFKKDVGQNPAWLQDLVDMNAAREILPGGMMWVEGLPQRARHSGADVRDRYIGRGADLIVELGEGRSQPPFEAPETPEWIRALIVEQLRAHPGRWARVYDGGRNRATSLCHWYLRRPPGGVVDAATRREGGSVAVYARWVLPGVM